MDDEMEMVVASLLFLGDSFQTVVRVCFAEYSVMKLYSSTFPWYLFGIGPQVSTPQFGSPARFAHTPTNTHARAVYNSTYCRPSFDSD